MRKSSLHFGRLSCFSICQAAAIASASCDCLGVGDTTKCTADQSKAFSDAITSCQ